MSFSFVSDLVSGVVGPEGSLHLLIHWTGIAGKSTVLGDIVKHKMTLIFEIIIEDRIHRGKIYGSISSYSVISLSAMLANSVPTPDPGLCKFLGLPDPDPLVGDSSIIKQK